MPGDTSEPLYVPIDPTREYLNRLARAEDLARQLGAVIGPVIDAGAALKANWHTVVVDGVGDFPVELLSRTTHVINPQAWPTAQKIGDLLAQWHEAHREVCSAWRNIPDSEKRAVQPPPDCRI